MSEIMDFIVVSCARCCGGVVVVVGRALLLANRPIPRRAIILSKVTARVDRPLNFNSGSLPASASRPPSPPPHKITPLTSFALVGKKKKIYNTNCKCAISIPDPMLR